MGKGRKGMTQEERRLAEIERLANDPRADRGPIEPLLRGERRLEPKSEKGAIRRAVNASKLELTDDQEAAAQLIRDAYLAITAGLWSKAQNYERVDRGAPTESMAEAAMAGIRFYREWIRDAGEFRAGVVLRHVMEGDSAAALDRDNRLRNGSSAQIIRAELDDMAKRAASIVGRMKRRAAA